jgi:hypothetical protein
MQFISFDKVKWYDWFWLVPLLIFGFIYSGIWTLASTIKDKLRSGKNGTKNH